MSLDYGDMVKVSVLSINREWGYNPCPDGTIGKVVDFDEIELYGPHGAPRDGVYRNRYYPIIEVGGQRLDSIYSGHLIPIYDEAKHRPVIKMENDYLRLIGSIERSFATINTGESHAAEAAAAEVGPSDHQQHPYQGPSGQDHGHADR